MTADSSQAAQDDTGRSRLMGSTNDTRYSASGNYFDQGGLIPGQGYRRGAGFASIDALRLIPRIFLISTPQTSARELVAWT